MHANLQQLLSIRDGAPVDAECRAHVAECRYCQRELEQLDQIVRRLNPGAEILHSTESQVSLSEILGTGRFKISEAEAMPEWLTTPRGEEETETEEYGISNFVYRRLRPFHPQRLTQVLDDDMAEGLFAGVLPVIR